MLDYLRSLDPMSRRMRNASRRITLAVKTLTMQLGRPPEEDEIANEFGVALDEFHSLLGEISNLDATCFDLTDVSSIGDKSEVEQDAIASGNESFGGVPSSFE